jgi:hypothetical protein
MKPYVTCHMNASVDGRILGSRWRPAENRMPGLFECLHEELGGGSWLIGRVTGSEYAKAYSYPHHSDQTYPREPWFARRDAAAYGIALDALVLKDWRSCWRGSRQSRRAASSFAALDRHFLKLSFIEVVLAIFVRGSDANAAACQCLPKKYLDFGIDAP